MSSVWLDADAPTTLGHSKHESPTLFRIQVGICQDEEALVLLEPDILFQVFEDLTCMELLHFSVSSNTRGDYLFALELREILLYLI